MKEEFQMRTLKKALSLVLVLAMVFTLAVPALAVDKAADFKDYDKVTNKEAVDVLTAIGVLNGNPDGTFGAEGTFTRAQAASIIAHMMLGKGADALNAAATGFSDVPANHWASGYIQYCVGEGILNGYGNGKFGPDDALTATQWALMLLGALGYDAKNEGIGGNGWEVATTKLAIQAGVASAEDLTGAFNRDMAAKLALNALKATLVEYTSNGTNITVGDTVINVGGTKATPVTTTVAKEQTISKVTLSNTVNTYTIEFAEKYFPKLVLTAGSDVFGRDAHTWTNQGSKIGTYAEESTLTYTTSVTLGTLYTDLGLTKAVTTEEVYNDGKLATDSLTIGRGLTTRIGGNGVLTQVYKTVADNGDVFVKITHVNTYVATVGSISKATSTADRAVNLTTLTKPNGNVSTRFETEGFESKDLVTYTVAYDDSTRR